MSEKAINKAPDELQPDHRDHRPWLVGGLTIGLVGFGVTLKDQGARDAVMRRLPWVVDSVREAVARILATPPGGGVAMPPLSG